MACLRSTLQRLDKLASLDGATRALFIYAFLLVLFIRLGLWITPFRFIQNWAARLAKRSPTRVTRREPIALLMAVIEVVARYVPAATCLTQALAAQVLLSRAGYLSTLRIGVLRAQERIKAHAWVECAGRVVIGGNVAGIEAFTPFPAI